MNSILVGYIVLTSFDGDATELSCSELELENTSEGGCVSEGGRGYKTQKLAGKLGI